MTCDYCGGELRSGDWFCRRCGWKTVCASVAVAMACLTIACGSTPTAPSAPSQPLPIVLSGQSNALTERLGAPLLAAYPTGVAVVAQGSTAISAWHVGGSMWAPLETQLHRDLAGFVWWQGETTDDPSTYLSDLRELTGRVRFANGNMRLRIVVIKVVAYFTNDAVRAAEELFVASDINAAIVRVDDLPTDGGNHVEMSVYPEVARRVVAALH